MKAQIQDKSESPDEQLMEEPSQSQQQPIGLRDLNYQLLMQTIERDLSRQYPESYYRNERGQIIMRTLDEIKERLPDTNDFDQQLGQGRGGNNVSENVKKAIKSTLKRYLGRQLYEEFDEKYIKKYNLKSQKENYVIFFLFLHKLLTEQKINLHTLENIREDVIEKIQKYIKNSEIRLELDNQRQEFHRKNVREFQKFLEINVDFTERRSFVQVREQLKSLYLRKVSVYKQAISRVLSIINEHEVLRDQFSNLDSEDDSQKSAKDSSSSSEKPDKINQLPAQNSQ